jgi:hypothetical protein
LFIIDFFGCNSLAIFGHRCQEDAKQKKTRRNTHEKALDIHDETKIIILHDSTFELSYLAIGKASCMIQDKPFVEVQRKQVLET